MATALVTGATGLVGSHIAARLLADGWRVRALVRQPSAAQWLGSRGVELAAGDVLDGPAFAAASAGCTHVFHTAAAVTPKGSRAHPYDAYRIPNVDGTRNAIAAAERAGARLLHLSSVAVYGPGARYAQGGGKVSEETPLRPLPERAYYARSKRESEDLVLAAHAAMRIWATAVRPDVIYGNRDRQFVPRIARLLRTRIGPVIAGGRTTLAIVHAASVADGAVRAATSDVAGGRTYNLANDFDVTHADFYRLAAVGLGHPVHVVSIPLGVATAGLALTKGLLAVLSGGSMNVVTSASLKFVTRDNPFTSDRARRELGWDPPVPPSEGIPAAFRWWKEHRR